MVAVLATIVLALPFQFAGIGGYFAFRAWAASRVRPVPRGRLAGYSRASRSLMRAAAYSAAGSTAILVAGIFWASARPGLDSFEALRHVVAAATVSGGWIALDAGRTEACGRLGRALRGIRIGGRTMCGGVVAELALIGVRWGIRFGSDSTGSIDLPAGAPAAAGIGVLGLIALAGFVALLAALSGKPRPSGTFAVLFYVVGRLGCVVFRIG